MKYSINSTGNIVAERDIYSLGGFIPKGSVGGKIASEAQLSQDGECWLASGGIANSPQVRITDNAYVGGFVETGVVYTDNEILISGDTLIPGQVNIRSQARYAKNDIYVKDSFIGVTMDVLFGPVTTTTAFPFEQGDFKKESAKGTLFTSASMRLDDVSACRNTATLRLGRNTYLYIPTGYRARVFWAYYGTSNQLAYSGESIAVLAGLTKLDHSVYKVAMISIVKNDGTAMTPANLLATGAKILGHVSGSVRSFINAISASGNYVMDNCRATWNISDFSFSTDRHAMFAGFARNCNMNFWNTADLDVCGRFSNIQQLDLYRLMQTSDYDNPNRDTFITASDCPLLRVTAAFSTSALKNAGTLVIRRCVVPKAVFTDNLHNNNIYEDIDFSYANEFVETKAGNTNDLWSSHIQGLYSVIAAGTLIRGFVSRPDNLALGSVISAKSVAVPLDGNIIEQGSYVGTFDAYYEDSKNTAANRVRIGRPLATKDTNFPSPPSGFKVTYIVYLREDFKIQASQVNPTTIDTANPYFVMVFGKADDSPITPSEFIALNMVVSRYDFSQVPEITGSAYVGAGVTVRGDVKLIGDPYVNRVFDVNEWDRGGLNTAPGLTWDVMKDGRNSDVRMTTKSIYPVSPGDTISVSGAYKILLCWFNSDQKLMSDTGWNNRTLTVPANAYYVGIALSTNPDLKFLDFSDIPLANVKYLRAFKKRRYITNELDRVSPEDILIGPDYWEQGSLSIVTVNDGKPYEELKIESPYRIRLKRPFGLGVGYRVTFSSVYSIGTNYFDAATKLLYGSTSANMNNALFALVGSIADSPTAAITPADVTAARLVIKFTPSPRIIVPYGSATLRVDGMRIRMYDNAVLSRNLNQEGEIVLSGDAVMGYDFNSGSCMCSNGHSDAIIKLP